MVKTAEAILGLHPLGCVLGDWGSCSASHALATSWAELEVKIANHNPIMLLWGKGTNPVSPTKQIIKMSSLGAEAA